jgi:hypothetical protein
VKNRKKNGPVKKEMSPLNTQMEIPEMELPPPSPATEIPDASWHTRMDETLMTSSDKEI